MKEQNQTKTITPTNPAGAMETHTKNPSAQALGRLGKGKPKTLTEAQRQAKREWMNRLNKDREARLKAALTLN